ncbi:hypothetical protein LP419_09585 [Massilia sp. H-1]|nr:hypothetical protein LP419_09585 [Massilia sp. H-1]
MRLAAWSHPLCILSGVTAVSPFFDRLHGALVVLARTSDGLIKLVKSPVTGLWNRRSITLPPTSLLQAPLSSASYVTCIRVIDLAKQSGHPRAGDAQCQQRDLGPDQWPVPDCRSGADQRAGRRRRLRSRSSSRSKAWPAPASKPVPMRLQPVGQSDGRRVHGGRAHGGRAGARARLPGVAQPGTLAAARIRGAPTAYPDALHGDVGDLFSWLECSGGGTVRIVHDGPTGAWHVVATIGGQLFHGVLDCVEKIVAATLWVIASVKGGTAPESVFAAWRSARRISGLRCNSLAAAPGAPHWQPDQQPARHHPRQRHGGEGNQCPHAVRQQLARFTEGGDDRRRPAAAVAQSAGLDLDFDPDHLGLAGQHAAPFANAVEFALRGRQLLFGFQCFLERCAALGQQLQDARLERFQILDAGFDVDHLGRFVFRVGHMHQYLPLGLDFGKEARERGRHGTRATSMALSDWLRPAALVTALSTSHPSAMHLR